MKIKQHFLGTDREFCFDSANNSCSEWAKNANHTLVELGAENGLVIKFNLDSRQILCDALRGVSPAATQLKN